jgi:hypothetical protein
MSEDWSGAPDHEPLTGWAAQDQFGVPLNVTGRHSENFYSMLGRIVSLAAILENKTLGFYQDLAGGTQDDFIELSISALIAKSLAELHRLPEADADFARQWMKDGTTKIVRLTLDDMHADLQRVVALLDSRRLLRFQGLVSARRHFKS